MSVEVALNEVVAKFEQFLEQSKDRDFQRDELLSNMHMTIFGDGNGNPGLRLRTDRLEHLHDSLRKDFEDTMTTKKTHIFAIWTAILGAWLSGLFGKP